MSRADIGGNSHLYGQASSNGESAGSNGTTHQADPPCNGIPAGNGTPGCLDASRAELYLTLIKRHFLCRTDWLCHKAEWGKPCPLETGEVLDGLLRSHLLGRHGPTLTAKWVSQTKGSGEVSGPFRLGTYLPTPAGYTICAVIDCDGGEHSRPLADPLAATLCVMAALRASGIPCYLERSKSGTGWHVWMFFAEQVPASAVRRVLFAILPRNLPLADGKGLANPTKGVGVEVFPKQDSHDYMGNQAWLPWWHGAEWPNNQFHRETAGGGVEP